MVAAGADAAFVASATNIEVLRRSVGDWADAPLYAVIPDARTEDLITIGVRLVTIPLRRQPVVEKCSN
jgi:2-methylisocitrate lyase-like PEP mutase family enzyme